VLLEPPEFAGHVDPNVWMDVSLCSQATEAVAKALAEFDPANAEHYKKNSRAYAEQLEYAVALDGRYFRVQSGHDFQVDGPHAQENDSHE